MGLTITGATVSGGLTFILPPGAPTIGTATATGVTTATVSYTAPASNGGGTITSYTAVSNPDGITASVSQSGSGTITVTGLTTNTPYTFTVYATNSAGSSDNSSASNQITPAPVVPDAPTIGTATATSSSTATVTYTAPSSDGGGTITSYTAVSNPGGITGSVSQSGSGTITVNGLTAGTAYTFTVYATNSAGNSLSSSASNQITTPVLGAPDAPTIGTASAASNTSAIVSYTESANQIKYSTYFDGVSGSMLTTPSSTTLALGTSDFTVEFWFNTEAKTKQYPILLCNGNFNTNRWQINDRHNSWPNVLTVSIYNNNSAGGSIVGTTTISNDTWYHVALVRSGTSVKLYLNGVQEGSTLSFSGTMDGGTAQTIYTGQDASQGNLTAYQGKISNLRIVKGVAVYTGAFTTPGSTLRATQSSGTNIAAITGTSTALLTCQSSTSVDNSTNNFTMTLSGGASISNTAPVGDVTSYTAVSSPGGITGLISTSGSGTITVTGLTASTTYTFTVYATNSAGNGLSSSASNSIVTIAGQQAYTTAGTYSWTVPENVYSISFVAVGGGGGGMETDLYNLAQGTMFIGEGGGGGALAYRNNVSVTPGQIVSIVVGAGGVGAGTSPSTGNQVISGFAGANSSVTVNSVTTTAMGGAAGRGIYGSVNNIISWSAQTPATPSGTYDGGGTGGYSTGGSGGTLSAQYGIGGGAAAGYSGTAPYGTGGTNNPSGLAGNNGSAGSGGARLYSTAWAINGKTQYQVVCNGGGGIGILGRGTSGTGAAYTAGGSGGSGGSAGGAATGTFGGVGGGYGGGGGGAAGGGAGGNGGVGAVRIIWPGAGRQFPSTNTGDV